MFACPRGTRTQSLNNIDVDADVYVDVYVDVDDLVVFLLCCQVMYEENI